MARYNTNNNITQVIQIQMAIASQLHAITTTGVRQFTSSIANITSSIKIIRKTVYMRYVLILITVTILLKF